jgi:hypothetical protein
MGISPGRYTDIGLFNLRLYSTVAAIRVAGMYRDGQGITPFFPFPL